MPGKTYKQRVEAALQKRVNKHKEDQQRLTARFERLNEFYKKTSRKDGIVPDMNLLKTVISYRANNTPAAKLLKQLKKNRYIYRSKNNKGKSTQSRSKEQFDVLMQQNSVDFRNDVRMSKEAFLHLHEIVKDKKEYRYKGVGRRQLPCDVQLMIALDRFGCDGRDASYGFVSERYGISEGEVATIMTRFIKVILHLSKDYLTWPTGDRKKEIIEDHRKRSGFTGCIGFIDGSFLSLNEKPFFQPNSFYNEREQQYVLGSTLVCAHNLEILYAQVGDFGTIHGLVENPENFFSSKEFVLGDETYPQKSWLLPMQHNTELSGSDIIFNKCISKMHIQAKTCVAAIKG
ncbi:unnamed protein product [Mucor hiemalis]